MNSFVTSQFWYNAASTGFKNTYLPAVVEASDKYLTCTYVPVKNEKPIILFQLTWAEITGRYYSIANKTSPHETIMTANGEKYTFYRNAKHLFKSKSHFPQELSMLCPDDNEFRKLWFKSNKAILSLDNLLEDHGVPVYQTMIKDIFSTTL